VGEAALSLKWLALAYTREGRFAKAELTYQQAVELWAKIVAPNDPSLLPVLREYLLLVRRDRSREVRDLESRIKAIKNEIGFILELQPQ